MLSPEIRLLLEKVSQLAGPVYLVGGSVRDIQLGKTPKDYDFTTPLSPDDIEAKLRAAKIRPFVAGKRFGTIGCVLDGHHVEITTFRTEVYDGKSRKPHVEFVSDITADLARRDFTINAMALRLDHALIDPFGGRDDIQKQIVRAVGKPQDRYREDPLRMLRAGRFSAQLGFVVDAQTKAAATKHAYEILRISKERWVRELDLILMSDKPSTGLRYLSDTRLLTYILPELAVQVGFDQDSPYHRLELWEHSLKTVDHVAPDVEIRWAALLHDIGKPYVQAKNTRGYSNYAHHDIVGAELVWKIGKYLRWGNNRLDNVMRLVREHITDDDSPIGPADTASRE